VPHATVHLPPGASHRLPDRSVDGGPSPNATPQAWDRARTGKVPVFTYKSLDEGGAQLCGCGIATVTPQHPTVASWANIHIPTREFPIPTNAGMGAHRTRTIPTRLEPVNP